MKVTKRAGRMRWQSTGKAPTYCLPSQLAWLHAPPIVVSSGEELADSAGLEMMTVPRCAEIASSRLDVARRSAWASIVEQMAAYMVDGRALKPVMVEDDRCYSGDRCGGRSLPYNTVQACRRHLELNKLVTARAVAGALDRWGDTILFGQLLGRARLPAQRSIPRRCGVIFLPCSLVPGRVPPSPGAQIMLESNAAGSCCLRPCWPSVSPPAAPRGSLPWLRELGRPRRSRLENLLAEG